MSFDLELWQFRIISADLVRVPDPGYPESVIVWMLKVEAEPGHYYHYYLYHHLSLS